MRWVGHVEHIEDRGDTHMVLMLRCKGKWPLGKPKCYGRIILKWIFKKWD